MSTAFEIAADNFQAHIARNRYPGRGIVAGVPEAAEAGSWRFVYFIMGRSANSRNRRFVARGGTLRTEPVDASLVEDPSLIIYEAMLDLPGLHLVSNGDQTRTLADHIAEGGSFDGALATREREPDAPNYTPRISAALDRRGAAPELLLSILKASPADPEQTNRTTFRPAEPPPGLGWCLTTYRGDGDPLPSFAGDPLLMPLPGSAEECLEHWWKGLDEANKISVAVKELSADGSVRLVVRNRHGDA